MKLLRWQGVIRLLAWQIANALCTLINTCFKHYIDYRATLIHIQCLIYTSRLSLKAPWLVWINVQGLPTETGLIIAQIGSMDSGCETVMEMSKPKLHLDLHCGQWGSLASCVASQPLTTHKYDNGIQWHTTNNPWLKHQVKPLSKAKIYFFNEYTVNEYTVNCRFILAINK